MSYEKLELLINGKFTKGTGSNSVEVTNPANGDILGDLPHASISDLDEALEASKEGFEIWRNTPAFQRQIIIKKAADLLDDRKQEIASTLTKEMGKPIPESIVELDGAIDVLRWYGEEGKRVYGRTIRPRIPGMQQTVIKQPVGPVIAFVAWNFPATNVMRKVAGALGAGCSITIKASEETPGTCIAIGRALMDAGLPPGVVNMVFGVPSEVSEHLCASDIPRKLSFTGSVPVGMHLQKLAANKMIRCTMELGGHAPVLVFDDADIENAANQMVAFKFRNAGQVCISPTRFLVQENAYNKFLNAFKEKTQKLVVGDGLKQDTTMGPLIASRRIDVMQSFIDDAIKSGGKASLGGERIDNQGTFYAPTVIEDVPQDAMIMNEEPFGPVAPFSTFKSVDDALEIANKLTFGLASYAFTQNAKTASILRSEIQSGLLCINTNQVTNSETPFGGLKHSGYGHENSIEGLEAFLATRNVNEIY